MEGGAYTRAALDYLAAGWPVVPVGTDKKLQAKLRTGHKGIDADRSQVEREIRQHTRSNIALRMPVGVVGIDVDAYDGKRGDVTIALLESQLGILPEGPWSSSRAWPSGIRFFRIPDGLQLPGGLMAKDDEGTYGPVGMVYGDVDAIQRHHRYAVVWPSLHLGMGTIYTWSCDGIPSPADLPELPQAWLDHFAEPLGAAADLSDAPGEDIDTWWESINEGVPSETMLSALPKEAVPGSRHDAMCVAQTKIISMAIEGEPGGAVAERMLWDWWQRVMTDRPPHLEYMQAWSTGLRKGHGRHLKVLDNSLPVPDSWKSPGRSQRREGETDDSHTDQDGPGIPVPDGWDGPPGVSPPADPFRLPEEFWSVRQSLADVRQHAHSRAAGADATLQCVLAKIASLLPGDLRVDSGVGTPASLNYYAGVIGPSGAGKSRSWGVARDLVPVPPSVKDYQGALPIGSGEGMCEAYMGTVEEETGELDKNGNPKTQNVRRQTKHNAMFYVDEGKGLTQIMNERSGSTLGQMIRNMWTGGETGQTNATQDRTRYVENYALGLVVGFQLTTVMPMMDGQDEGTPQRFMWCLATDPNIPDTRPPAPEPMADVITAVTGDPGSPFAGPSDTSNRITLADSIKERLWSEDIRYARGDLKRDVYDSQKPVMLIKVSSLLTVLDGRTHVTEEDWSLAETVYGVSAAIRDRLLEGRREQTRREAEQKTAREVDKARQIHEVTHGRAEKVRAAALVLTKAVAAHGPLAPGKLKNRLRSNHREFFEDAAEYAADQGWVLLEDGKFTAGPVVAK